jgi:hypothetical protein
MGLSERGRVLSDVIAPSPETPFGERQDWLWAVRPEDEHFMASVGIPGRERADRGEVARLTAPSSDFPVLGSITDVGADRQRVVTIDKGLELPRSSGCSNAIQSLRWCTFWKNANAVSQNS